MEQGFKNQNSKTQSRQNPKQNLKHKLAKPKAVYETQSSLQNTEQQNTNQESKHKLDFQNTNQCAKHRAAKHKPENKNTK